MPDLTQLLLLLISATLGVVTLVAILRVRWLLWFVVIGSMCFSGTGLSFSGITIHPEQIAGALLALRWLHAPSSLVPKWLRLPLFLVALWLLLLTLSSVFFARQTVSSLYITAWTASSVIVALLIVNTSASDRGVMLRAGSAAIGVTSLASCVAVMLGNAGVPLIALARVNSGETLYRTVAFVLEPNLFGSLCFCWAAVMWHQRSRLRASGLWSLPIVSAGVLSLTRTVWLAFILLALAICIHLALRGWRYVYGLVVVVLGVGTLVGLMSALGALRFAPEVNARLLGLLDLTSGTGAFRSRTWDLAIEDLQQGNSWLHGFGANSFTQLHSYAVASKQADYLSNAWLAAVHDGGFASGVLLVLIFAAFVAVSPSKLDALAACGGLALCATLTNPLWFVYPWLMFMLVAEVSETDGLGISSVRRGRETGTIVAASGTTGRWFPVMPATGVRS